MIGWLVKNPKGEFLISTFENTKEECVDQHWPIPVDGYEIIKVSITEIEEQQ